MCRHRFLPGSKGGLNEWPRPQQDSASFWWKACWMWRHYGEPGLPMPTPRWGRRLNNLQLSQWCRSAARMIYICFDADTNGSGQREARNLRIQ